MLGDDLIKGAKGVVKESKGVIGQRQVYDMVKKGQLPVIRKGNCLYFRRSELEAAFRSTSAG